MLRRATTFFNPFTRTAVIAFVWAHRRTILRWGRSLSSELRRPGRIEPKRLQLIARVLWAITSNDELAKARQLREVRLDGNVLVLDTAPGWNRMARLVDELDDIPGIVRIVDQHGDVLAGTIVTTAR
ncbi:hypothetical protein [Ilumatobacter sp.]|uniref:hypothetical protein n=1 Tax=Ilumatobacter sp. TaxID=1967498 RepID=UPI003AF4D850